jgi:predicted permease
VTSPIVIAVAIGIVLASTGLLATMQQHALSGGVLSFVKMLGGLTVPLICLSIGYDLQIDWANIRKPIAMAFTRLALWLVLAYGISLFIIDRYLHLDSTYQLAVFTMLVLPPSFGLPIFIPETERANKQLLLQAISIHILLAIATFMVIAAVL